MDDDPVFTKLNQVWRICRKIQAAIFKHGFNINNELIQLDPHKHGLVAESKFGNILGRYKRIIGLSDFEIREVTDYFRIRDGRVAYKQFIKVVCEEGQDHSKNLGMCHGLEWNDPMHVNLIKEEEKRHLCLVLMKVARTSAIPLQPYFQDYELVANNVGTVTVAHFSRVLHFMKIKLSEEEFLLLLKRYMKDSYTVNYVAFVAHINAVTKYLKENGLMDVTKAYRDFPGKLVDLDMPKLPNPIAEDVNKKGHTFEIHERPDAICNAIFRIQRHLYANRIRISEFLESYDSMNNGTITKNQFIRGLDNAGISSINRLKLSQREMEQLCERYRDTIDSNRIRWRVFVDEVDRVFTEKNLDKQPKLEVESPLKHVINLPRDGQKNWQAQEENVRDLCEEVIMRLQKKITLRRIYLHPFFKNYDKLNKGHVLPNQAFQILLMNSILVSEEEFAALSDRYSNDIGFNYMKFLEDVDPAEYAIPKMKEPPPLQETPGTCPEPCLKKSGRTERDVINALANAKKQAVVNDIKLIDFFMDYDNHRENQILEVDFRRALDTANIKLSVPEVDIICDVFRSTNRGCTVRYRDFCKAIDEIFIQGLTKEKISTPLKHFPCVDCIKCFLNFDERTTASKALQKLARMPDIISNLQSVFKDFDKSNCGTITQNQFLRALTVRDMHNLISSHEFGVVCKCFGYERGQRIEFNYRDFLEILTILYETGQTKRNF